MSEDSLRQLPYRIALAVVCVWFAGLDRNPLVRIEAILGLSPSPLERLVGLKGPFSGMTEGAHRLAHGDLAGAMAANVLTPLVVGVFVACLVIGYRPRIRSRRQELWFFATACIAVLVVNLAN